MKVSGVGTTSFGIGLEVVHSIGNGLSLKVAVSSTSLGIEYKSNPYAGGTNCCFQTQSLCWWSLSKTIPTQVV